MVKKFKINCDFGGQIAPFEVLIGTPQKGNHPLHFQADWLSKTRGGVIPGEIMEAISKLQSLSEEKGVLLEDLCVYALGAGDSEEDDDEYEEDDAETELSSEEDLEEQADSEKKEELEENTETEVEE